MEALATHRYGHRVLLAVLSPSNPRLWPPSIMDIVAPPAKHAHALTTGEGDAATDSDEDMGIVDDELDVELANHEEEPGASEHGLSGGQLVALGTSKKAPRQRQLELLKTGGAADELLRCAAANAGAWLCNGPASNVMEALAVGGSQGTLVNQNSTAWAVFEAMSTYHLRGCARGGCARWVDRAA